MAVPDSEVTVVTRWMATVPRLARWAAALRRVGEALSNLWAITMRPCTQSPSVRFVPVCTTDRSMPWYMPMQSMHLA